MGFSIRRSRIGKLTFKQRLACIEDQIIPFFSILNTVSMITMQIFLFTDFQFIYYRDLEQLKLLLRLKCLGVLFSWINLLHTSIVSGYQTCVREGSNELWMAPCKIKGLIPPHEQILIIDRLCSSHYTINLPTFLAWR
jgi:hypothetical protein